VIGKNRELVLFVLFSGSAAIVQLAVFSLLFEVLSFGYWLAYVPSILALVFWNTYWNRKYTFRSDILFRRVIYQLLLFYLFFIPIFTLLGDFTVSIGWNEYVVLILTMIINLGLAFLYNKYIIYKN
jgi:putative flippase GtrA